VRHIVRRERRSRPAWFGLVAFAFFAAGALLAACSQLIPEGPKTDSPNTHDQVQSLDLLPRFPQPQGPATVDHGRSPRDMVYPASADGTPGANGAIMQGAEPAATGDGYDLSFENAPVGTVAKVVLGDILGAGYIIDPRAQGTVTLSSGRPVPKGDVLYVLKMRCA
jgi:general secretion pathway protein D